MANYEGAARTNYFKVKDAGAFKSWAAKHPVEVVERDGMFALLPANTDDGCFYLPADGDDGDPLDLADELAKHLTEDSIAIVMESGHEKLRYICGRAVAVNHLGGQVVVSLQDIYEKAKAKWNIEPTEAIY